MDGQRKLLGTVSLELRPGEMRHVKLWTKHYRDMADEGLLTPEQAGHVCRAEETIVIAAH